MEVLEKFHEILHEFDKVFDAVSEKDSIDKDRMWSLVRSNFSCYGFGFGLCKCVSCPLKDSNCHDIFVRYEEMVKDCAMEDGEFNLFRYMAGHTIFVDEFKENLEKMLPK